MPWGLALLPGGDLLVTSRDTRQIWRINLESGHRTRLGKITEASSNGSAGGEGGLLGIAVSPDFSQDHRLFIYYSTADDNRIAGLTYHPTRAAGRQLSRPTVILNDIPHGLHHNGGRIA
ncbi:MAG TPA: PQQ-dependent sugar dehydrogenase, partial [Microlunatus sp.]